MNHLASSRLRSPRCALLALCLAAGCDDGSKDPAPQVREGGASAKTEWTMDEMAADPEGYLKWATARLDEQRRTREERLKAIDAQRKDVNERRSKVAKDVDGCLNVSKRMEVAIRRADDEDRWPLVMGQRTYDRARAEEIVQGCTRLVEQRKPFLQIYDDALAKLDQASNAIKRELAELKNLREQVALDLERVRLTKTVGDLAQLQRTENEIAHYSRILTSAVEETATTLPKAGDVPAPVDAESLLK